MIAAAATIVQTMRCGSGDNSDVLWADIFGDSIAIQSGSGGARVRA
jgi:hypothetical protein